MAVGISCIKDNRLQVFFDGKPDAFAENVIYEEPLFVYPLLFYANKLVKMSDKLYIYRQNNYGTICAVI